MARAHTEVQTTKTKGHKDLSESDESLGGLCNLLFPDYADAYDGPGAHTAQEIHDALGFGTHESARSRARKATNRGELVQVQVIRQRTNGGKYLAAAWVKREIYDEWKSELG
jgi:hypothetical protein